MEQGDALPFIKREATEGEGAPYRASHHGRCHGRPCGGSDRWDVHGQVSHFSGFEINKSLLAKTRGACVAPVNGPRSALGWKEVVQGSDGGKIEQANGLCSLMRKESSFS